MTKLLVVALCLVAGCATTSENTVRRGVIYCGSRMPVFNDNTGAYNAPVPCVMWYFDWKKPLKPEEKTA